MKTLYKNLVKNMIKKKMKISIAESCTGGLLSSSITSVSGSSKVFNFALVTYSDQSKIKVLGISRKVIKKYGVVSKQVCKMMTKNISKIGKTKMALSITGIAGPSGGTKNKPVGLVYIGIKNGKKVKIKKYLFKNKGRYYIQRAAVNKSLRLMLRSLK